MNLVKLLAFVILFAVAIPAIAETPEEIIEKSFEKRGGLDKITSIKSWTIEGKAFDPMMQMEIPTKLYFEEPSKIRFDQTLESMNITVSVGYDGETAWVVNPMSGSNEAQIIDPQFLSQVYNIVDNLKGPLYNYKEEDNKLEYNGKKQVDDKECFEIKVTDTDGNEAFVYFDAISYFIHKIHVESDIDGSGVEQSVDTFFKSPTKVNGIIFHELIETNLAGEMANKMEFTSIKLNEKIDSKLFAKP